MITREKHILLREKIYIFKEVIKMKDGFKKAFGAIVGIWAGMVATNFLGEALNKLMGNEDTSKKEESDFEEES